MSELQFFATEEDHADLISILINHFQARFVLDGTATPEVQSFTSVSEVIGVIEASNHDPRFYVLSPIWQAQPLSVRETKHDDGRIRYYINSREGGPAFDYLASRPRKSSSGNQILASWFGDYPTYRSSVKDLPSFCRPEAMANAYKVIHRHALRHGVRTEVIEQKRAGPRALSGAVEAFKGGAWLRVGDLHHEPRKLTRHSTGLPPAAR